MEMPDGFKPWRGDVHPNRLSHKPSIYYLAYGSNLLPERIYGRCSDAVYVGRTVLKGWRMLFKKSKTGCFATIEQDANREVPCVVFKVSEYDEAMLDKYEGYPRYYYKRKFEEKILFNSGKWSVEPRKCIAYILHEERVLGMPSDEYMGILIRGYSHWGFDEGLLWTALSDSVGEEAEKRYRETFKKGEDNDA